MISRYIVDFITFDGKLVVEVDGGTHSTAEEMARDEARTKELERLGFHVIRVTNDDVYRNIEGVLATILSELERS